MTVLQTIILNEVAEPESSVSGLNRFEALRSALRHERTARKAIEKTYQAKICELQDENERLKDENRLLRESRLLATEAFNKNVQELELQFNARYLAAIESFKKEAQATNLS